MVAYKLDRNVVDQVSFGFRIFNNQHDYLVIDEDTPGFKSILDDLSNRTNGEWPNKYNEVALPPFETCWTELWIAPESL
ncbi:MAG: hypothetical protein P1U30_04720, partial [Phycisphaerales bacterium]|nr:hypothetical protein [Phycisphaerales bacterium]